MRRWLSPVEASISSKSFSVTRQTRRCIATPRPPEFRPQDISERLGKTKGRVDPYTLLGTELTLLRERLFHLLGSSHPGLTEIASYYLLHPSKQLRPLLVLLFSRATNGLGRNWSRKKWAAESEGAGGRSEELDQPLSRADVLNDWNPSMPDHTASFENVFSLLSPQPIKPELQIPPAAQQDIPTLASPPFILPTQMRLAQIVEMIHVASLMHDDVIDKSDLRRGVPSAPAAFGNKLSILAGDFLLGRASVALSRLGENEATELISSVITNLVEGEILQMKEIHRSKIGPESAMPKPSAEMWKIYLKKSYLKTASLMAKGARSAVVLGGSTQGEVWKEVAYAYGRNLGIAFQASLRIIELLYKIENIFCDSSSMIFWTMKQERAH